MQYRIPKILISLALAVPVSLGPTAAVRTVSFDDAMETVRFYCHFPDRLADAVAGFKTLPERTNPTLSECN